MFSRFFKLGKNALVPTSAILRDFGNKLVGILISDYRDKRQEYRIAYAKFAETFSPYLQQLEMRDTDLNSLIMEEFQKHDLARRNFDRHLSRSRKRLFNQKWGEYAEKYYQIKDLGATAKIATIVPPDADLKAIPPSFEAIIQAQTKWDDDRRKEICRIIHDLLHICEP